jgi:hypothetical protein
MYTHTHTHSLSLTHSLTLNRPSDNPTRNALRADNNSNSLFLNLELKYRVATVVFPPRRRTALLWFALCADGEGWVDSVCKHPLQP